MKLNIIISSTAFIGPWQTATGGISTGMTHAIGLGPFDPDSLPKPLDRGAFLTHSQSQWFSPRTAPPESALEKAVKLMEGFGSVSPRVRTETFVAFEEKIINILNPSDGIQLARHAAANYLTHDDFEVRLWALRFLGLFAKPISRLKPPDLATIGLEVVKSLNDEHPKVRKMTVNVLKDILFRLDPQDRVAAVLRIADRIDDENPEVRQRAINAISDVIWLLDPEDRLTPLLRVKKALADVDPDVIWAAIGSFCSLFRTPAFERFTALFRPELEFCKEFLRTKEEERQSDWRVRREAQSAGHHGEPDDPSPNFGVGSPTGPERPVSSVLAKALWTLNLTRDQVNSREDVKRAFRQCALKCHPDQNPCNQKAAAEFTGLMKAYLIVCLGLGFEAEFQ